MRLRSLAGQVAMTRPGKWICSAAANGVTGMRYTAGKWDAGATVGEAIADNHAHVVEALSSDREPYHARETPQS